jgi:hypothetical protein
MPLLRGHHLICLHFFQGDGYDDAFIINLRDTLNLAEKEDITVCSGADNVCTKCPYLKQDRCTQAEHADEEIRAMDAKALELLGISSIGNVSWDNLRDTIFEIFPEWFSLYCMECNWKESCEKNISFQQLSKKM